MREKQSSGTKDPEKIQINRISTGSPCIYAKLPDKFIIYTLYVHDVVGTLHISSVYNFHLASFQVLQN